MARGKFGEAKHTALVALIGLAGAVVMACSAPVHAEKIEWTPGCVASEPLIRAAGRYFHVGWSYPFAKAFARSDRTHSPVGRALLLTYIDMRYGSPSLSYGDFLQTALDACSKTGRILPKPLPYHGAEFWIGEGDI